MLDSKPHPHIHEGSANRVSAAKRKELSIWFFCGILMVVYGVVLVCTGIYESNGHQPPTVLAQLHPTLWWGCLLTAIGLFYSVRFRPGT